MTFARLLAVAAVLAGSVLGFAGPAKADQVLQGVYSYTQGNLHAEWTIYPSCVPTVGDLRANLDLPVACRLHVGPTPADLVGGGDARLTGGQWAFSTNSVDGLTCPDGSTAPLQESYRFDDVTMAGTRSTMNSAACAGQVPAKVVEYPFTLAFERPLNIPVQQYPLYCEPGGLKRCF
jgi:hypothetical protein